MKYMDTYYNNQIEGSIYQNKNLPGYTLMFHYYGENAEKELYPTAWEAVSALRKKTDFGLHSLHGSAFVN